MMTETGTFTSRSGEPEAHDGRALVVEELDIDLRQS